MYETQSEEVIIQRMLDRVSSDLEKREGSFIYDALSPAAIELALAYIEMDRIIQMGFAQTTSGQYLEYRAAEHGLSRKAATKASGSVTIVGLNGSLVPAGSLFATGAGVNFHTLVEVSIGEAGQVTINIEAVEAGAIGNVPANAITAIPVSISGVTGVSNLSPTSGGTDAETDLALQTRLLEKVRLPATSGNAAHYMQWAKETPGIGDARILPIWNGNGTVKVIVIDSNKQPANVDLIQDVTSHIEGLRPIGAAVTVISTAARNIDVSAALTLESGCTLEGIQPVIQAALTNYLKGIAFQQNYVSYAQIGSIILDCPGVLDHSNLLLNSGTANVSIADDEVAVLGTVTLT